MPNDDIGNVPDLPGAVGEPAQAPPAAKKKARKKRRAKRAAPKGRAARVKVGADEILLPKSLAANVTPKDVRKLKALFKRIRKRGVKSAAKKTRKSVGRKRVARKRAAKKR